jgi:hypothetical protein
VGRMDDDDWAPDETSVDNGAISGLVSCSFKGDVATAAESGNELMICPFEEDAPIDVSDADCVLKGLFVVKSVDIMEVSAGLSGYDATELISTLDEDAADMASGVRDGTSMVPPALDDNSDDSNPLLVFLLD